MIRLRFFLSIFVCIPCLFIDDFARADILPVDGIGMQYCQILEEKLHLNLTVIRMGELNLFARQEPVYCETFVSDYQPLELCFVAVPAVYQSFSQFSVQIQQFTSRSKPESDSFPVSQFLLFTPRFLSRQIFLVFSSINSLSAVTVGNNTEFVSSPVISFLFYKIFGEYNSRFSSLRFHCERSNNSDLALIQSRNFIWSASCQSACPNDRKNTSDFFELVCIEFLR